MIQTYQNKRVTAYDVAKVSGVSQPTVSRILGGQAGKYRQATQLKVHEAVVRLGYRPSAAARTTRTGRFGAITLLLSTGYGRSNVPTDLFNTVLDLLAPRNLSLMAVKLPDDRLIDEAYVPRILRETNSDGLIIDYTHAIPRRLIDLIDEHQIPAVWLNSKQPYNCVRPDDMEAAQRATRHLLELGHRRIAYADFSHGSDFPTPHYSVADREASYRQEMIQAGLTPVVIRGQGFDVPSSARCANARAILEQADRPTAVLCYSASTTTPFSVSAASLGMTVPGDLSVMSFDDEAKRPVDTLVTTMLVPQVELGRAAVELLIQCIALPRQNHDCQLITFGFEAGATVSAPATIRSSQ